MNYDDAIKSTQVVLVEFYASWCPHCQRMAHIVENIREQLKGKVDVYQYEIDDQQALADKENVRDIPTFIVYRDGNEMWRQSGEMTADDLMAHIRKYF